MTMHVAFQDIYRERILRLADKIERLRPYEFDVARWLSASGGPSCIASWAVATFHGDPKTSDDIGWTAHCLLGLDLEQARALFTPRTCDIYPDIADDDFSEIDAARHRITRQWAAATLRHLAATGMVDWQYARSTLTKPRAKPQRKRIPEYLPS